MVDIIPKKTAKEIPLKNISLFIAGALLFAMILGYAIMLRIESAKLLSIQDLEEGISKMGTRQDRIIENKVFDSEIKVKKYQALSAGRRKTSQFFDNFEGLIHPRVWFSSFGFNPDKISASVSGKTINFEILEQQLLFLKSKSDLVEGFDLSKIAFGKDGGVDFNLTINFTPKIFEAPEQ